MIWLVWFINTFFTIIVLLNFLIAVITESYSKVVQQQQVFAYLHKSELNAECYELLSVFLNLPEYRAIAFTSSKEETNKEENQQNAQFLVKLKKLINQHTKEVSKGISIQNMKLNHMENDIEEMRKE